MFISVTGLSRSVFAKPHIRKILVEYGISRPDHLDAPVGKADSPCNINTIVAEKDGYIQRLLAENDQLKYEIELLRGKIHLLMHELDIKVVPNENQLFLCMLKENTITYTIGRKAILKVTGYF